MFENFEIEGIPLPPLVIRPNLDLHEAYAVEVAPRQAVESIGEFLWIPEGTAIALYYTDGTADIGRHAPVPRRVGGTYAYAIAGSITPLGDHRAASIRVLSSVMRCSISTRDTFPFSSSRLHKASPQRS